MFSAMYISVCLSDCQEIICHVMSYHVAWNMMTCSVMKYHRYHVMSCSVIKIECPDLMWFQKINDVNRI